MVPHNSIGQRPLKQPGLKEKAKAFGATAFLEKPFESEALLEAIEDALQKVMA